MLFIVILSSAEPKAKCSQKIFTLLLLCLRPSVLAIVLLP